MVTRDSVNEAFTDPSTTLSPRCSSLHCQGGHIEQLNSGQHTA
jgi:hypothetical protein